VRSITSRPPSVIYIVFSANSGKVDKKPSLGISSYALARTLSRSYGLPLHQNSRDIPPKVKQGRYRRNIRFAIIMRVSRPPVRICDWLTTRKIAR
jgi:hypothetical protein